MRDYVKYPKNSASSSNKSPEPPPGKMWKQGSYHWEKNDGTEVVDTYYQLADVPSTSCLQMFSQCVQGIFKKNPAPKTVLPEQGRTSSEHHLKKM